jgi:tRNA pseudouridine13 synthase
LDPEIAVTNPTSKNNDNAPNVAPPMSAGEDTVAAEAEAEEEKEREIEAEAKDLSPSAKKQRIETTPEVEATARAPLSLDWDAIQGELLPIVGESPSHALVQFVRGDPIDEEQQYHVLPSMESKDARRTLHELIRTRLGAAASADTVDGRVRVWHKRYEHLMPNFNSRFNKGCSQERGPRSQQSRQGPARDGTNSGQQQHRYMRFVVYKENMDTNSAMRMIQQPSGGDRRRSHNSSELRLGFAGMKDKRGITCQFATFRLSGRDCAEGAPPPRIVEAMCRRWNGPQKDGPGAAGGGHTQTRGTGVVRVGSFAWVDRELKLGDLRGNRFDIVLRNLQDDNASVEAAATALRDHGFINYFGTQRFGKYKDTHLVGMAVLRGDYESAVDIILRPKSDEMVQYHDARVEWRDRFKDMAPEADRRAVEKRCAERVVRKLGRFMSGEVSVLHSLARHPLEYKRAFSCISKTLRMMYLHAVQSYVWNHVASHRVKSMSRTVVAGDLIMICSGAAPDGNSHLVRTATEEDVAKAKYSLEDVVLPLIGRNVRNPDNDCSTVITRVLQDHGLDLDMFHRLNDRDLDVSGDYRKLLCHPQDVDFEFIHYSNPLQPLIQTDLMRHQGIEVEADQVAPGSSSTSSLRAIRVGFTLPPSSYATIALRELMKRPTSSDYQSEQKLGEAVDPHDDPTASKVSS